MKYLRTNTDVIVTVGPFYDKTDGVTIETGLTITNERITLVADTDDGSAPTNILDNITGATSLTANDLNYITGNDAGMMQLELAAANVNRLGRMTLSITDAANHLPVVHEFMVLPAVVYDAMILGTDLFDVSVTQWLGTAAATPTTGGVPEVDVTHWIGTAAATPTTAGVPEVDVTYWLGTAAATPTVAGVPEVDVTHNAGTAITSASGIQEVKVASMAAAAITAAAIATDAIDADALAADAVTEIWAKAMSDLAAVPGATASVLAGINWLFELARNKRIQTATTETVYKDDGTTALATSTKTDGGTTFTLAEFV